MRRGKVQVQHLTCPKRELKQQRKSRMGQADAGTDRRSERTVVLSELQSTSAKNSLISNAK